MTETSIRISRDEYNMLKKKADLFDHFVETEELSSKELQKIERAMRGPFMAKSEFLKRHPEIA